MHIHIHIHIDRYIYIDIYIASPAKERQSDAFETSYQVEKARAPGHKGTRAQGHKGTSHLGLLCRWSRAEWVIFVVVGRHRLPAGCCWLILDAG